MNNRTSTYLGVASILLVLLAASVLLLYKLGAEPLQDYDEATYAEVATENIASSDHLSFTFLGTDYFRKPPLLFWFMDVSQSLISNQEVGARLPSALSGILTIAVVMVLAGLVTGSIRVGAIAGAVLTTTGAFIEPARQARFDVLISFFMMAALYAFLRAAQKAPKARYWYIVFGVLLGLAFLTKGPLIIYVVAAIIGASLVYGWKFILDRLRDPYVWGGVGAFFVVVLPWHIYETVKFGYAFWEEYLGDQVLNRVGVMLFNGPTNMQYFWYLFSFAAPWPGVFCVSLVVLAVLWKKVSLPIKALSVGSVVGVAAVLAVCLITKTKAISYLIPLYPFMAVTIALTFFALVEFLRKSSFKYARQSIGVLHVAFLVLVGFALYTTIWNAYHLNPYYGSQVQLAQDEKAIGEYLLIQQPSTFYEYNNTLTVGSIMFYSKVLLPGVFDPTNPPPAGSFVLYQTSDTGKILAATAPEATTSTTTIANVYSGKWLSLAVTSEK